MVRKTKTRRSSSSSQRSDNEEFWLSILLIITCVCLILSILIISFCIYREIDRSPDQVKNVVTETPGKFKGQYKVWSSPSTTTAFWTPLIDPPKSSTTPRSEWTVHPATFTKEYTVAAHPKKSTTPRPEPTWNPTKFTEEYNVSDPPKTSTTPRPEPTLRPATFAKEYSVSDPPKIITSPRSESTLNPATFTKQTTVSSPPKASTTPRLEPTLPPAPSTKGYTISDPPKTSTAPRSEPTVHPAAFTKEYTASDPQETSTSPRPEPTLNPAMFTKEHTTLNPQKISSTSRQELTSNTSTSSKEYTKRTTLELTSNTISSPKMVQIELTSPIPVHHSTERTSTSTTKTDHDDSIIFIDDDFSNKPEAERNIKETSKVVAYATITTQKIARLLSASTTLPPIKKSISNVKSSYNIKRTYHISDVNKDYKGTLGYSSSKPTGSLFERISLLNETVRKEVVVNVTNETRKGKLLLGEQDAKPITSVTGFTSTSTNPTMSTSTTYYPTNAIAHAAPTFNVHATSNFDKQKYKVNSGPRKTVVKTTSVEASHITNIKYIEKDSPPPMKVCETISCKLAASKMVALIDHNSDPCEDFYSYACGGIAINCLKNPQYGSVILDKLDDKESIIDKNTEKLKQFYDSCTNFNLTEGLLTLKQLINEIFFTDKNADKRDSLTMSIAKIIILDPVKASFGLLPIFDVRMELDANNLFMPTLTIPSVNHQIQTDLDCIKSLSNAKFDEKRVKTYYDEYDTCTKSINQHMKGFYEILKQLSGDFPIPDSLEATVELLASLPKSVNKRTWNQYHQFGRDHKPVYFSIKDLQENYPEINWGILLKTLFQENASKISEIRIMFKDQVEILIEFYKNKSIKDLLMMLRIIFIYDMYNAIIRDYDRMNIKEYCLKKTVDNMEDLATKILLTKTNKKDLENIEVMAKHIFSNIKDQFKTSIRNSSWLSDTMKNTILSKLDKSNLVASVENQFFNEPLLNYRYEKMKLTNNFIDNIVSIKRNKRSIMYRKINNEPRTVWMFDYNPLSTQSWTIPEHYNIILPQGLLMKLAYKKRRAPQLYELYARLGFQITRSIATFFEPSQLKRLLPGIEENEVYKNYLHVRLGDPQVAKAINKYDIVATKEDLLLSQDARFADDLTIRLTIDTYNNTEVFKDLQFLWLNFTIPQLFYLTMAQDFCQPEETIENMAVSLHQDLNLPNFFRINSLLMNSIGFSDAYHCPLGSAMNPALKADAFPYISYTEIDYL